MAANTFKAMWGPGIVTATGGVAPKDTLALNSATDELTIVFRSPRAGVLDNVQFDVESTLGGVRTWDVRFEGVDASGRPDGVAFGGMVAGVLTPAGAGHETVAMATGATVTQGDLLCMRVVPTGPPFPDGGNRIVVELARANYSTSTTHVFPFVMESTDGGATWAIQDGYPSIGIQYADGDWLFADLGDTLASLVSMTAFDSADTPNEYGARFQVPYAMEIQGVRMALQANTNIHPIVKLYDASSVELRSGVIYNPDANNRTQIAIWERIDISALTNYFIGVTNPSGVTTIREPFYWIVQDAAQRSAWPFYDGLRWARATRTGAGAWTVTETEIPGMALYVNGVG